MEAKSHDLPSASWRVREANSIIQSESKGLRTRGVDGITPTPSPKAENQEHQRQISKERKIQKQNYTQRQQRWG